MDKSSVYWRFITITLFGALLLGSSLLLIKQAQNLEAADSEGSSSGIFINPVPASAVVTGVGTDFFTWGVGVDSPPSSLRFTGATFATEFDKLFSFGTLAYFNGTIQGGTQADAVDLKVTIVLTMPSGVTKEFTQTLTLVNTLNVGTPEQQADRVHLPTSIPKIQFTVDGVPYTLEFLGFGTITGAGSATTIDKFFVFEGGTASAELLGRITACGEPGFQLTQFGVPGTEEVGKPGTEKKLCYKFNLLRVGSSETVAFSLTLKNTHQQEIKLVACAMVNTSEAVDDRPQWRAFVAGGTWTAVRDGTASWPPSFHFACRRFTIPAGGTVYWFDLGSLPASAGLATPYIDFLRDFPLAPSLRFDCTGPSCVRGRDQFLVPDPSVGSENYANYWALMQPLRPLSPEIGCTMEWPVGNWVTMRDRDTYLARLNGTVLDAPTGSVLTFHFPSGSPHLERIFVVPAADPANPTGLGLPVEVAEPFVIPYNGLGNSDSSLR